MEAKLWLVSGQMTVGIQYINYNFTLVEYQLYIDEISWTIFSPLGTSLDNKFHENFWQVINHKREGRPELIDIPWIDDQYDAAPAYLDGRLHIYNEYGRTIKTVCPFKWNNTYLKIYPNGAAIYANNKNFEFLLPWIVLSHDMFPSTPLFWMQENKGVKIISLFRISL